MRTFVLREERHAQTLWAFLKANWKAMADAGKPLQVTCGPEQTKRSIQANRRYWAIIRQISEEGWLDGRQFGQDAWHEFFKRRFIGCEDLPGGQTVGLSSAKLTIAEFSAYSEQVEIFAVTELGIELIEMESAA